MFIAKVGKTIRQHAMLSPGDRVVIAVSGGPDSVCLLNVLRELSPDLGLELHIAHLDHAFRGAESAAEARFVRDLAGSLGIPAAIERRDVPAYCASRGVSAQEGAREVRYAFLADVARTVGAQRIAVGHTANDQAETVLMRLLRGAGTAGLAGIPPKREWIVRPLIDVSRREVLQYLQDRNIAFVNDPSNEKSLYTRNRVRHELIPALERFNPRIVETLAAEAALLRDDNEALGQSADLLLREMARHDGERITMERDLFLGLPTALRRRVLRGALGMLVEDADLAFVQTEQAIAFLEAAQTGRSMEFPAGIALEREYGSFVLRCTSAPPALDRELVVPGKTDLPTLGMIVETEVRERAGAGPEKGNYLWQAEFDYDKITTPLRLRSRRPGDAIRPAGMGGGSKKLQDLFVDAKVPRSQRDRVPLLAAGPDVLWVVGMRTDGRFLPGPGTKRVLVVTVRKSPLG